MAKQPIIRAFFDEPTNTVTIISGGGPDDEQGSRHRPRARYDQNDGTFDTRSVAPMLRAADEAEYAIEWALETHVHADHLSGALSKSVPSVARSVALKKIR